MELKMTKVLRKSGTNFEEGRELGRKLVGDSLRYQLLILLIKISQDFLF